MKREVVLKNRVRELRERSRLRQTDLANRVGVTRQTILAIEKGRLNPSVVVSLKIARILGEPIDYVFYLERSSMPPPPPVLHCEPRVAPAEEPSAVFDFA